MDDWRDLGGIRTTDGRTIRPGALVRARSLDDLTEDGWAALHDRGVRTLIDLRNDDERSAAPAPPGITAVHVPLDGSDREFWDEWAADWRFGTPVYYAPHIARFPERSLAVLTAIAYARPGGVLYHCMGGRDRTGMITMLVLALVGVAPEDIAADYELSAAPVRRRRGGQRGPHARGHDGARRAAAHAGAGRPERARGRRPARGPTRPPARR